MLVLGVNRILKWCQITTGWGTYTRPIKEINGELHFRFKNVWWPVSKFIADNAQELIDVGGKVLSRPYNK